MMMMVMMIVVLNGWCSPYWRSEGKGRASLLAEEAEEKEQSRDFQSRS